MRTGRRHLQAPHRFGDAGPFRSAQALGLRHNGGKLMRKVIVAALGAAIITFAVPAPAQELPLKSGEYWDVASISVDDGHFPDYVDFLAGEFRKRNDFSVSKGWIKGYRIFSNVNPRDGEPDLYLVTIFDHVPTPAEDIQREKEMTAFMALNTRQSAAGSGRRATYRKLRGDMLLQELVWSR
jgi:hypothetical protein